MMKMKKTKAFGLIEVLIASAIIIIVVLSLAMILNSTLKSTYALRDRAQAINLAQEGIEVVRQIRDSNWIDQKPETNWDSLIINSLGNTNDYNIALSTATFGINFDNLNHFPNRFYLSPLVSGTTDTIILNGSQFKREIKFFPAGNLVSVPGSPADKNTYAVKVMVTVTTPSGVKFPVSEILTNWRPNY